MAVLERLQPASQTLAEVYQLKMKLTIYLTDIFLATGQPNQRPPPPKVKKSKPGKLFFSKDNLKGCEMMHPNTHLHLFVITILIHFLNPWFSKLQY